MELRPLYALGFGVGITVLLLVLLRVGQKLFGKSGSAGEVLESDNTARQMVHVGQVLAVFLVSSSVVKNTIAGKDPKADALWAVAMACVGLVLLVVSARGGLMLLLKSQLPAEIARGNRAAGFAAGAHYVATGIIASRAVAGSDLKSLGLSLVFFVIAQITLHVFVSLFRFLTVYDDAEQIRGENLAAAISYGGVAIAVALLVARALDGDFVGWAVSLKGYGFALLFAFALWPVRQILVQSLLLGFPFTLRGGKLDDGIARRNEGMGALEAVAYLATALSIVHLA